MKDEIELPTCNNFVNVKKFIDDWIDYYNTERYVWDLVYLSPNEYYQFCLTGVCPLTVPIHRRVLIACGSVLPRFAL